MCLQLVFGIKRCAECMDNNCVLAGVFQKVGKNILPDMHEPRQSKAVDGCPVCFIEIADAMQQIFLPMVVDVKSFPVNTFQGTCPSLVSQVRETFLKERSVKPCIMGDNQFNPFKGLLNFSVIDFLTFDILVGDACQYGDLFSNRLHGIFVFAENPVNRDQFFCRW